MYLDYFNLDRLPFQIAPDYHFLYLSRQHARAMAYMKYTVANHEGFAVISGEIGSGKTTLIQKFLVEMDDSVTVIRINQSLLNAIEFLQTVACELGVDIPASEKVALHRQIRQKLDDHRFEGRHVLLLIDDAQNLNDPVLEEIRLLSDSQNEEGGFLSVILIGQPELEQRLKQPPLRQLDQRVRLRFKLGPLSDQETELYIQYRMSLAGWEGQPLFDSDVAYAVYRYTGGVPRLVNVLCDSILLNAFVDNEDHLSVKLVERAASDLEWEQTPATLGTTTVGTTRVQPEHHDYPAGTDTVPALLVSTDEGFVDRFPLKEPLTRIGRSHSNDLQLAFPTVGEFHAAVINAGERYYLADLNSGSKTLVDGTPVTRQLLADGMQIEISPYNLRFVVPQETEIPTLDEPVTENETDNPADAMTLENRPVALSR